MGAPGYDAWIKSLVTKHRPYAFVSSENRCHQTDNKRRGTYCNVAT